MNERKHVRVAMLSFFLRIRFLSFLFFNHSNLFARLLGLKESKFLVSHTINEAD